MKCIINQPQGLGDVLFSMPIAKHYYDSGYEIYWPLNISTEIAKHFPFVNFVKSGTINFDEKRMDIHEKDGMLIIPLRWCNNLLNKGNPCTAMSDKYKFMNMPLEKWRELTWVRDYNKENELYNRFNIKEPYNIISDTFTPDFSHKININVDNGLRNIKITVIKGFTLLDWYRLFENATTIHIVGSSNVYMLEVMDLKADSMYLYPRKPHEYDCKFYNYLLKKPYKEIL
jgi:hypothetical protein